MKYFYSIVFLLIPMSLCCQCEIDAGEDKNICFNYPYKIDSLDARVINGDFVKFIWEGEYYSELTDNTYYASSILNDTNLLNPVFEQFLGNTMKFYLTGVTSNNLSCRDSVKINFSDWTFLTLDKAIWKNPKDTASLWISAFSNWPHIQYEWSPNYMISDTTVEKPIVWNDTTISYELIITDSLGCKVNDDPFEVYVLPTSTNFLDSEDNIKFYPNPATTEILILNTYEIKYCDILSLDGKLLKRVKQKRINLDNFSSGIYLVRVIKKDNSVKLQKFIIKK